MSTARPRDEHSIRQTPTFHALKGYLIELTGLTYYADKEDTLADRVSRRIIERRFSGLDEYFEHIKRPDGANELDTLIEDLAIGETYFFRNPVQFDLLRDTILPERMAARRPGETLRLWSAGCSSGAEPYSVAAMINREMPELTRQGGVAIRGTDLCSQRIERARRGLFSNWELRGMAEDMRSACFLPQENRWQLKPEHARHVTFERQNLLDLPADGPVEPAARFDIILCRNVLIYFDVDIIRRTLTALRAHLVEGGWLLVGHAEPFLEIAHFLTPVCIEGTTVYRRLDGAPPLRKFGKMSETAPTASEPTHQMTAAWPEPRYSSRSDGFATLQQLNGNSLPLEGWAAGNRGLFNNWSASQKSSVTASESAVETAAKLATKASTGNTFTLSDSVPAEDNSLSRARAAADEGDWPHARKDCEAHIAKRPLDPDGHFLLALVLEHSGGTDAAIKELRQVVYLESKHALAHFHLGRLYALKADRRRSLRSFSNTASLVAEMPPGSEIRGGDGLKSDELAALTRNHMERLTA